ncbi:MBL fold metallo-hydrolase [Leeia aquatica]|uniref:MBL fold metallo-hydrolase n=1 Tax=Leeia aquatica TaxID=2725557 RepID=A0A847RYV8_9NEIS|nr:MBL fold metallo-hydrolase [Leeia aquatica]NLR74891.1 MBL fold metallo-hydrolase [Leeia aquatica]
MKPRLLFTATLLALSATLHAAPLQIKVYSANDNSFNVNSTLVYGDHEAMVIDAGFTRADALRIAANVLDSGRTLKTILVSQADPDYYFGVEVLHAQFPQAEVVATPAVLEVIRSKLKYKLEFWGPKMGNNAPQQPVLPKVLNGNRLTLDGEAIEIRGTTGPLAHRPYVWIPSIRTLAGNVAVFNQWHVWTADTATPALRSAWRAQLDEMQALQPQSVVPGHMKPGSALDVSAIRFTRDYLQSYETALQEGKDGATVIQRMKQQWPAATGMLSLEIGAKVNKGEMPW